MNATTMPQNKPKATAPAGNFLVCAGIAAEVELDVDSASAEDGAVWDAVSVEAEAVDVEEADDDDGGGAVEVGD